LNYTIDTERLRTIAEDYLSDFSLDKYSLSVNIKLKDKFSIYNNKGNIQQQKLANYSNYIIETLGLNFPAKLITPVYESYQGLSIVKIFLDNIFNSVMFFLSILCILLIYSLMLGVSILNID